MKKLYEVKFETIETIRRINVCEIYAEFADEAFATVQGIIDNKAEDIWQLPSRQTNAFESIQIDDYEIGGENGFGVADVEVKTKISFEDAGYTYDDNIVSAVLDAESQTGMLDDSKKDEKQLNLLKKVSPRKIWSVYDHEDDRIHVRAGVVDEPVIYYIITTQDWSDPQEDYFLLDVAP